MEETKKTDNKKADAGKEKRKPQSKRRYWGKRGQGPKGEGKRKPNEKAEPGRQQEEKDTVEKTGNKKPVNKQGPAKKDSKKKKSGRRPETNQPVKDRKDRDQTPVTAPAKDRKDLEQAEMTLPVNEQADARPLVLDPAQRPEKDKDILPEEGSSQKLPEENAEKKEDQEEKSQPDQPKVKVIGVRFQDNGKIYYFSAEEFDVKAGHNVIVETARGVEYGKVVFGNREVEEKRIISTLKPVIRIATQEDDQLHLNNIKKSREAFDICLDKISKHGLDMKLIDCEYTFDNNKVLFYFTADGRIDFRELVKDLAAVFKTRIELRQIGVRDETKIKGGIGICGRELCCNTFLSEFIPVSIKMAKEQNLSLNPTKISGVCGRLMCCLKNEQDTYEYLNRKMPNNGDEVTLPDGRKGVVQGMNVLRQKVRVIITDEKDEKELVEYDVKELTFYSKKKKEKVKVDGELKKLEALEMKENKSKL